MQNELPFSIDVKTLSQRLSSQEAVMVLDVREPWEFELCALSVSLNIPLGILPQRVAEIPDDVPLAVMCHHGGRSARATQWLRAQGYAQAQNVEGGVDAWARQIDSTMRTY